jgi:hypothetical protein
VPIAFMTCENVNYLTRGRIRDDKDETSVISGHKNQHPGCGMFKPMIGKKWLKSPSKQQLRDCHRLERELLFKSVVFPIALRA